MTEKTKKTIREILNRREFILGCMATGSVVLLSKHFLLSGLAKKEALREPAGANFFSLGEYSTLAIICDFFFAGAAELGAVTFIETLLTAFDSNPPKIFAHGGSLGVDGSGEFLPLTREQEFAWRLRIYGSEAMPGGGPNDAVLGKTEGLRPMLKRGIAKAQHAINQEKSSSGKPKPFRAVVLGSLSQEFKDTVRELTLHSIVAQPIYGGNKDLGGWKIANFPGDQMGFSVYNPDTDSNEDLDKEMPVAGADKGTDPAPINFWGNSYLRLIALMKGRNFR